MSSVKRTLKCWTFLSEGSRCVWAACSTHSPTAAVGSTPGWKLEIERGPRDVLMTDHAGIHYGRAILTLHAEFNGRAELPRCHAGKILGTSIEPAQTSGPSICAVSSMG
jgi:hypothetical protein